MSVIQDIKNLMKQLLPTGRAFKMPLGGDGYKLIESTSEELADVYNDIKSTLDVILPDNDNFTDQDATDWEIRLGMIVSDGVALEDRKAAIIRKMNYPGTIIARQSADYIEGQLRLAGFNDVWVHENPDHLGIEEILYISSETVQSGDVQSGDAQSGNVYSYFSDCLHKIQSGDVQSGDWQSGSGIWCNKIANHVYQDIDKMFYIGDQSRTFVIGGEIFGEFGEVDNIRKLEFRQLILKLKPVDSVAYLLVNYT